MNRVTKATFDAAKKKQDMPNHTSSPERIMLTNITWLIRDAEKCPTYGKPCPLMGTLLAIKKSLQTELRQKGENDREIRP